ncbi:MAG: hypothetical protein LC781_12035 [Actinobacteria bacterium]|nr:hypothetical protein [Actinomycetota bacterium]
MAEVTMEGASKVYGGDVAIVPDTSPNIEDWETYRRSPGSSTMAAANASGSSRNGSLNVVLFYVFLVVFALSLAVIISNFAAVYTVDYGARVAVALVVLVMIFRRTVASGPIAGAVKA